MSSSGAFVDMMAAFGFPLRKGVAAFRRRAAGANFDPEDGNNRPHAAPGPGAATRRSYPNRPKYVRRRQPIRAGSRAAATRIIAIQDTWSRGQPWSLLFISRWWKLNGAGFAVISCQRLWRWHPFLAAANFGWQLSSTTVVALP